MDANKFQDVLQQLSQQSDVSGLAPVFGKRGDLYLAETTNSSTSGYYLEGPGGGVAIRANPTKEVSNDHFSLFIPIAGGRGVTTHATSGGRMHEGGWVKMHKVDKGSNLDHVLRQYIKTNNVAVMQLEPNERGVDWYRSDSTKFGGTSREIPLGELSQVVTLAKAYTVEPRNLALQMGLQDPKHYRIDGSPIVDLNFQKEQREDSIKNQFAVAYDDFLRNQSNQSKANAFLAAGSNLTSLIGNKNRTIDTPAERKEFSELFGSALKEKPHMFNALQTNIALAQNVSKPTAERNIAPKLQTASRTSTSSASVSSDKRIAPVKTEKPTVATTEAVTPADQRSNKPTNQNPSALAAVTDPQPTAATSPAEVADPTKPPQSTFEKNAPAIVAGGFGIVAALVALATGMGGGALIIGGIAALIGVFAAPAISKYVSEKADTEPKFANTPESATKTAGLSDALIKKLDGITQDHKFDAKKVLDVNNDGKISDREILDAANGNKKDAEKLKNFLITELSKPETTQDIDVHEGNTNLHLPKLAPSPAAALTK